MTKRKLVPQTKAAVILSPAVIVVRTDDGRHVALEPRLAADVARQILAAGSLTPAPAKYLL